MIKKIFLILILLLFSFGVQVQGITVSDIEYKNYLNRSLTIENNLKKQVNTALNGVELKNGEFIVLSGNLSQNNKLFNYKINSLNISDEKANLIISKLNESKLTYNYVPDVYNPNIIYDEFSLYISAKPQYELNKGFIVLIDLTNEKLKQDKEKYIKIIEEYGAILDSKLYPEFFKIKNEYGIPDDKMLKIHLSIDKNGNLLNSEIISSINPQVDSYMLSIIRKLSPFDKLPSLYAFSVYDTFISYGNLLVNRFKQNATNTVLISNYSAVVKIKLDKRGDVVFAQIAKSSNNDLIDKELLNTIKKVNFYTGGGEYYSVHKQEFYLNIMSMFSEINMQLENFNRESIGTISYKSKNLKNWNLSLNISAHTYNEQKEEISVDFRPYMTQFQQKVKKQWNPPKSLNSKNAIAYIVLNKDGHVVSRSIVKSSGDKEVDDSALKAIDNGVPYPKFPNGYDKDIVSIQFTFDYTTIDTSGNKKNSNNSSNYNYNDCEFWYCKQKYK